MRYAALVLAGSRPGGDPLARDNAVEGKALIEVGGRTMLSRVVDALRAAGAGPIYVSSNAPAVRDAAIRSGAVPLPAEAGPSGSVRSAIPETGVPLLVTTADHALLAPEWIAAFVDAVPPCDVAALLARRATIEAAVPETRRTFLRFEDGAWSGCNLFWLATPAARRAVDLWGEVERDRKRPWRIVRRLGVGLLLRYLVGRLTLAEAIAALGARAGIVAAVVESPFGLAAVDVDKPEDLTLVRRLAAR